jgi:HlyD family secretion protein
MNRKRAVLFLVLVLIASAAAYGFIFAKPRALMLTGIVTTNDVIVSPQIAGQIAELLVKEGDTVTRDQLLVRIVPDELAADRAYYTHSAAGMTSQVRESEAALRFQERQLSDQVGQAEANIAAAIAAQAEATATLEQSKLTLARQEQLSKQKVVSAQEFDQARTGYAAAQAHLEALNKQIDVQRATLAMARSNAEQVSIRRSQLGANEQQHAAAEAQRLKADTRLAYTELHAPIDGIVDVRAARLGEVVTPAQPVLTLINQDDLWVRADVEETYIDRLRLGDQLTVRLPSGEERQGTVFYRGVDAGFATQRDVSRTKRDIKTFEVRLRVDNKDRKLAVGMTAYVLLTLGA